jgi:hypothetical protein
MIGRKMKSEYSDGKSLQRQAITCFYGKQNLKIGHFLPPTVAFEPGLL